LYGRELEQAAALLVEKSMLVGQELEQTYRGEIPWNRLPLLNAESERCQACERERAESHESRLRQWMTGRVDPFDVVKEERLITS
jgi:hypothetical protein